jgi:phage-related protein
MRSIGPGAREIRVRDAAGSFRVICVAAFADAVHVLRAFRKQTRKTANRDVVLAAARLQELMTRKQ